MWHVLRLRPGEPKRQPFLYGVHGEFKKESIRARAWKNHLNKRSAASPARLLRRVRGSGGCAEEGAIPQDDLGEKIPEEQVAVVFEIVSWMI